MADAEYQDRRTIAFPENDLTRRLLRRATEPIGVVTVRHAAELHSRASIGLGPRLELLDNIKTRYGPGAGGAAAAASPVGGMSLIALQRMAAGPPNFAAAPALANRAGTPETATGSVPTAASAPQYRVKRPDRAPEPYSSMPSETIAALSPAAVGVPIRTNSTPALHLQRKANETPSLANDKPDSSALPLVRAAAVDAGEQVDNKPARARDGSLTTNPLPQVNELPSIATVAPLHVQRKSDRSSAAEAIDSVSTPPDFRGDLPLPHKVDHPPAIQVAAEEIDRFSTFADFRSASIRGAADNALSGAAAGDLPLQRKIDPSALSVAGSVPTAGSPAAPPATNAPAHGAVATELRVSPSPADATRIVWRKAAADSANRESAERGPTTAVGQTHTSGLQVMRQVDAEAASNGDSAPVATPALESNGVDIGQIAEQVSRMIARQLRVERERWGRR